MSYPIHTNGAAAVVDMSFFQMPVTPAAADDNIRTGFSAVFPVALQCSAFFGFAATFLVCTRARFTPSPCPLVFHCFRCCVCVQHILSGLVEDRYPYIRARFKPEQLADVVAATRAAAFYYGACCMCCVLYHYCWRFGNPWWKAASSKIKRS
jgi:hypothetical protein